MSEIIDKFEICSNINENLKTKIKSFFVFDDTKGYNVLFVTNDDDVYSFGKNTFGSCGLGHNDLVENPEIIKELCKKNIERFLNGFDFVLAHNNNNQVFGWGQNNFGQLGRGYSNNSQVHFKPELIEFGESENIFQISSGLLHSLALTHSGKIYGWGDNRLGQICNFIEFGSIIYIPIPLKSLSDMIINSILCLFTLSCAVTDMTLFIWGGHHKTINNKIETSIIIDPYRIDYKNLKILSICQTDSCMLFLANDKFIYVFEDQNSQVKLFDLGISVIGLISIFENQSGNFYLNIITEDKIYLLSNNNLIDQNNNDLLDYYTKKYKMTPKTIQFKETFEDMPELGFIKMQEFLEEYNLCSGINRDLYKQIKSLYTFDQNKGVNVLFVTYNGDVFACGVNNSGCCGLGHNNVIKEPQIIPELCGRNIKDFYNGCSFVLALTFEEKILSWGANFFGELGRGCRNAVNEYFKPALVLNLDNIKFSNISCGDTHTLALTSEGDIYAWGNDQFGQIGCGLNESLSVKNVISKPFKLTNIFNSVKSIYASISCSFVLTNDGKVYSWGYNAYCVLGQELKMDSICYEPKVIKITNVISLCPSTKNTYFLTEDGTIYACGHLRNEKNTKYFEKTPKKLQTNIKFKLLYSLNIYRLGMCIATAIDSNSNVYYICSDLISKQEDKTIFAYYLKKFKITFRALSLKQKFYYDDKFFNFLQIDEDFKVRSRFENIFQNTELIGEGAFGAVYRVLSKIDRNYYAIKRIDLSNGMDEKLEREVNTLSKIESEFVVKYFESWIENNKFTNNNLYIKMELCSDNLKNIMEQKPKFFNRKLSEEMSSIEYFITCHMFKELLECLKFLHELDPPIIHRDIKPENILLANEPVNGRYLKIADFGLATYQEMNTMTHTKNVGTGRYMAPEVWQAKDGKSRYSVKADIYGLAVTTQELFDYDINNPDNNISKILSTKWNDLLDLIDKMLNHRYRTRPTCADVLKLYNKWAIDRTELKNLNDFKKNLKIIKKNSDHFLSKFFNSKYKL